MNPLRILVTRPESDSQEIAKLLHARGHEPVIEPLLTIAPIRDAEPDLSGAQALLFTSANGVRAFVTLSSVRDLPAFAVGDATARAARDAGFAQVKSANGDVADLAALVCRELEPKNGALVHIAGTVVAGDLAAQLGAKGFSLRRAVLYEAKPAMKLSQRLVESLRNNDLDAVIFFSPRTAATFVTLTRQAGLEQAVRNVDVFCLSPAVANAAGDLPWRKIRSARQQELTALLDEIDAAR